MQLEKLLCWITDAYLRKVYTLRNMMIIFPVDRWHLGPLGHWMLGTFTLLYTNPSKRLCRPYSQLGVLVNLWVVHCHFFLVNMLWAQQICYPTCGQEVTVYFCAWHSAPRDTVHGMPRLPVSPVQLLQPHWTNIHSPLPVSLLQHYNAEIELRPCLHE